MGGTTSRACTPFFWRLRRPCVARLWPTQPAPWRGRKAHDGGGEEGKRAKLMRYRQMKEVLAALQRLSRPPESDLFCTGK